MIFEVFGSIIKIYYQMLRMETTCVLTPGHVVFGNELYIYV